MKAKRFVVLRGYEIAELKEKINILEKQIIKKDEKICSLEKSCRELNVELKNKTATNTNEGKIRNMSFDELVERLVEQHFYGVTHEMYFICPTGKQFDENEYDKALEFTKQWLKSNIDKQM